MQYMMMIYLEETSWSKLSKEQLAQSFTAFMEYNKQLAAAGVLQDKGQLQPSHTATVLRGRGGKVVTTDGPFAETKDQLGGYYVLEVPNLDAALEWAGKCPALMGGASVEIRPILAQPGE